MVNKYLISHLAAGDSFRAFLATDPETALTAGEVTLKDVEHELLVERLRHLLALPLDGSPALVGRASILSSDRAMSDAQ